MNISRYERRKMMACKKGRRKSHNLGSCRFLSGLFFFPISILQATLPCAIRYQVHPWITVFITLCCDFFVYLSLLPSKSVSSLRTVAIFYLSLYPQHPAQHLENCPTPPCLIFLRYAIDNIFLLFQPIRCKYKEMHFQPLARKVLISV